MKAEFKNTKKEFEPIEVTITLESMDEALTLLAKLNNPTIKQTTPNPFKTTPYYDRGLEVWNELGLLILNKITRK